MGNAPAGRWIDPIDSRELNLAGYGPLQEAATEGHADCAELLNAAAAAGQ